MLCYSLTMESRNTVFFICLFVAASLCAAQQPLGSRVGGKEDVPDFQNNMEIKNMAQFAVKQYNQQQNKLLEYRRVVKAQKQVVSGTLYYLTVEVKDGKKTGLYLAQVWVQPWRNPMQKLVDFKPVQKL